MCLLFISFSKIDLHVSPWIGENSFVLVRRLYISRKWLHFDCLQSIIFSQRLFTSLKWKRLIKAVTLTKDVLKNVPGNFWSPFPQLPATGELCVPGEKQFFIEVNSNEGASIRPLTKINISSVLVRRKEKLMARYLVSKRQSRKRHKGWAGLTAQNFFGLELGTFENFRWSITFLVSTSCFKTLISNCQGFQWQTNIIK